MDSPACITWTSPASSAVSAAAQLHCPARPTCTSPPPTPSPASSGAPPPYSPTVAASRPSPRTAQFPYKRIPPSLEILADQAITVTSVNGNIEIKAQQKIAVQAGSSSITLEGSNITLACPGKISVKGAVHGFKGASTGEVGLEGLPTGTVSVANIGVPGVVDRVLATLLEEKTWVEFHLVDSTDQPLPFEEYVLLLPDGRRTTGQLDAVGSIRIEGVKRGLCAISFPSYNLTMRV